MENIVKQIREIIETSDFPAEKIIADLSKQYNLPLIPFLLEGVALKTELNLSDGLHPNEKGTIIISKTLQEIILKNL